MPEAASLWVKLGARTAEFTSGMKKARRDVDGFSKEAKRATSITDQWRKAMAGFAAVAGLGYVTKQIFDMGAAVEETGSKFSTVFGQSSKDVQVFIDDFANMAGLSDRAAKDIVATTGAIVQGMGLAREASAEYATQVVKLAGDLSSFNNIPIEETSRAIQAAITGEREQLKRLGIVILEADVQKRALAMTGKEVAKSLTQEEKAMATLELISERAGVAVGDLVRTQESAANKARALGAAMRDTADAAAVALQPALKLVLDELTDMSRESQNVAAVFLEISGVVEVFTAEMIAVVRTATNTVQLIFGTVTATILDVASFAARTIEVLVEAINLIPGVDLVPLVSADELIETANLVREAMKRDIAQIVEAWGNVGVAVNNASERVRQFHEVVEEASDGVGGFTVDMSGLTDASHLVNRGIGVTITKFDNLKMSARRAKAEVQGLRNEMSGFASKLGSLAGIAGFFGGLGPLAGLFGQGSGLLSSFAGLFAEGGMIPRGQFGLVGERGPEIVTGPAQVMSTRQTAAAMAGGGEITLNLRVQNVSDGTVQTIRKRISHMDDLDVPVTI